MTRFNFTSKAKRKKYQCQTAIDLDFKSGDYWAVQKGHVFQGAPVAMTDFLLKEKAISHSIGSPVNPDNNIFTSNKHFTLKELSECSGDIRIAPRCVIEYQLFDEQGGYSSTERLMPSRHAWLRADIAKIAIDADAADAVGWGCQSDAKNIIAGGRCHLGKFIRTDNPKLFGNEHDLGNMSMHSVADVGAVIVPNTDRGYLSTMAAA